MAFPIKLFSDWILFAKLSEYVKYQLARRKFDFVCLEFHSFQLENRTRIINAIIAI